MEPARPRADTSIVRTRQEAQPVKVFIVEDSPAICERLVEMIEAGDGNTVVGQADTYEGAVAGIAESHPDVAIFDIKLASGNGIGALAAAKRGQPDLHGIVMSNHPTPQHRKASVEAGAEYFLDKSIDFERIPEILGILQAKQRQRPA
jgi:DNA-binding NarL/FixJ family response regulator